MRTGTLVAFSSVLTLVPMLGAQTVRHVPGQYPTIGAALAASRSGDTVVVAPGNYVENLTWPGIDGIRLRSLAGPASTTIDGGAAGKVILFRGPLSNATLVEGFTIRNGYLNTTRNHGAGIEIDGCSPTLRGNVIRDNVGDGTSWNYGGGIHIDGGSAVIESNRIEANVLRNGSWNYGGGIYVTGNAQVTIVGNTISGNRCELGSRAYGAGIHVGFGVSALIASNLVTDNLAAATIWNYGAGIYVVDDSSGSRAVDIVNVTVAANTLQGGSLQRGGGLYLAGNGITLANSIVANNTIDGVHHAANSGTLTADWNCVFGHTNGYVNANPGPNDLSVDPLFVSPVDHHLQPSSPCVDSGSNAALVSRADIDIDLDPRRSDGDLDGSTGNGARIDRGADELCPARLTASAPAAVGTTVPITLSAPPGHVAAILLSGTSGSLVLEPWGTLLVDPIFAILIIGPAPLQSSLPIPPFRVLVGVQLHLQGLAVDPGMALGRGAFSNRLTLGIR